MWQGDRTYFFFGRASVDHETIKKPWGSLKIHYPVKKVYVASPTWGFQIQLNMR